MTANTTLGGALTSTDDLDWIIEEAGYDPLREGGRGSRFAVGNSFVGVCGIRAIHRGGDELARHAPCWLDCSICPTKSMATSFDSRRELGSNPDHA
jgi:hypothetical protein